MVHLCLNFGARRGCGCGSTYLPPGFASVQGVGVSLAVIVVAIFIAIFLTKTMEWSAFTTRLEVCEQFSSTPRDVRMVERVLVAFRKLHDALVEVLELRPDLVERFLR